MGRKVKNKLNGQFRKSSGSVSSSSDSDEPTLEVLVDNDDNTSTKTKKPLKISDGSDEQDQKSLSRKQMRRAQRKAVQQQPKPIAAVVKDNDIETMSKKLILESEDDDKDDTKVVSKKQAHKNHRKADQKEIKTKNTSSDVQHSAEHGVRGLQNLGNTCFMNSVLQVLNQTVPAVDFYLLRSEKAANATIAGTLSVAFSVLINKLRTPTAGNFSPKGLLSAIVEKAPQFRGYHQHDAQELLCVLLDGLQTEYEAKCAAEDNPITQAFTGSLCSTIICHSCHQVSQKI